MFKRSKAIVINPIPKELGSKICLALNANEGAPQFEDITPLSLVLLYKEQRSKKSSKSQATSNRGTGGGAFTVALHEFMLDSEKIMPKKTVGQLAVFDSDGVKRLALLNLSLYRYLCIFALLDKKLKSSDGDEASAVCRPEDFERIFFEFGEKFDHEEASGKAAPEVMKFLEPTISEMAQRGISLIRGRLPRGYWLDSPRSQVRFVGSPDNWSRCLNSQIIL